MVNEPNVLYLIQDAFEMFTIQLLTGKISRNLTDFQTAEYALL